MFKQPFKILFECQNKKKNFFAKSADILLIIIKPEQEFLYDFDFFLANNLIYWMSVNRNGILTINT